MSDFWIGFAAAWIVMLVVMFAWLAFGYWADARDRRRARHAVAWNREQAQRDHEEHLEWERRTANEHAEAKR